jgi:hypothetical protein
MKIFIQMLQEIDFGLMHKAGHSSIILMSLKKRHRKRI